jgi:hypothetical protein
MTALSPRLRRRLERDFPERGSADGIESILVATTASLASSARAIGDPERIQAAIVLWGHGDLVRIKRLRDVALEDWRDALVAAELADEDWRQKLDRELGSNDPA